MDYARAIKANPAAKAVTLADLAHNSDSTRLDVIDEYALAREKKYSEARKILLAEDQNAHNCK